MASEYYAAWLAANKDARNARRRKRYKEDPEYRGRVKEARREWSALNPEKVKANAAVQNARAKARRHAAALNVDISEIAGFGVENVVN